MSLFSFIFIFVIATLLAVYVKRRKEQSNRQPKISVKSGGRSLDSNTTSADEGPNPEVADETTFSKPKFTLTTTEAIAKLKDYLTNEYGLSTSVLKSELARFKAELESFENDLKHEVEEAKEQLDNCKEELRNAREEIKGTNGEDRADLKDQIDMLKSDIEDQNDVLSEAKEDLSRHKKNKKPFLEGYIKEELNHLKKTV